MSLANYRKRVNGAVRARDAAVAALGNAKAVAAAAGTNHAATAEALTVATGIAQAMQQKAHTRIARVVSRCLTLVFEEPYEFRIEFETKRNKTEARMAFVRGGVVLEDPKEVVGGGVLDVAAFGLRLAALMFSLPQRRRVIIMDEPFKHISATRRGERVAAMLEALANEFSMQFIMVTHMPELRAGIVYEVE
jgi:predicted ATPase